MKEMINLDFRYVFLLAILGFDPAQNLEKWLCGLLYPTNRSVINYLIHA